jgi:hypothetical protein
MKRLRWLLMLLVVLFLATGRMAAAWPYAHQGIEPRYVRK